MIAIKYILYFHFYFLSGVKYDLSTTVIISTDSVMFYAYDAGYVKWRIDKNLEEICYRDYYNRCSVDYLSARYILSHKDLKALMIIKEYTSEIIIMGDGKSYHILLKR